MNKTDTIRCQSETEAMQWIANKGGIDDVVTLDAACNLMLKLHAALPEKAMFEIRQLHGLVGLPQSQVLRAVLHLEQAGLIDKNENLHDPLGSVITMPQNIVEQIDRITQNG